MGCEGSEPVHGEVVVPDNKDGKVDGQDPQHDDQDRVSVMVKVPGGPRALGIAL